MSMLRNVFNVLLLSGFLMANAVHATVTNNNVQVKAVDMNNIGTSNDIRVRFLKSDGSPIVGEDGCMGSTWWTKIPADNDRLLSMLLAAQASKANSHIVTHYVGGAECNLIRFQIDPTT